ncbi:MAG: cupin domain-containing protein [Candidatus Limnocylindrales bacterium]
MAREPPAERPLATPATDAFDLVELRAAQEAGGRLYHEFLRRPAMSAGLYHLPAGGTDPQGPHREDELYLVVAGHARLQVGDDARAVGPGSVVFVDAGVPHRFLDISEDLDVYVVFAPPET